MFYKDIYLETNFFDRGARTIKNKLFRGAQAITMEEFDEVCNSILEIKDGIVNHIGHKFDVVQDDHYGLSSGLMMEIKSRLNRGKSIESPYFDLDILNKRKLSIQDFENTLSSIVTKYLQSEGFNVEDQVTTVTYTYGGFYGGDYGGTYGGMSNDVDYHRFIATNSNKYPGVKIESYRTMKKMTSSFSLHISFEFDKIKLR